MKDPKEMTDKEETWIEYRRRVYGLTTEEKKEKRCVGCGTTKNLIFRKGQVVCENCYECSFNHDP